MSTNESSSNAPKIPKFRKGMSEAADDIVPHNMPIGEPS